MARLLSLGTPSLYHKGKNKVKRAATAAEIEKGMRRVNAPHARNLLRLLLFSVTADFPRVNYCNPVNCSRTTIHE